MRLITTLLSASLLCGCSSLDSQQLDMYSKASHIPGEIVLSAPIQQKLPGPDGLPITLFIDRTTLALSMQMVYHNYYCAPESSARARHATLGSITHKGDCIGIRIDKINGKKEWVIENQNFTNSASLWVKEVAE